MMRLGVVVVVACLVACSPPAKDPELTVSAIPSKLTRDGKTSTITVDATDALGKPGTGELSIESSAGSLSTKASYPLNAGQATATLSCDVAGDAACGTNSVVVSVAWVTAGKTVRTTTNVSLVDFSGTGGGTGGSGGSSNCVTCPNGGKVSGTGGDGAPHEATWTTNGSLCPVAYTFNGQTYYHNTLDGVLYPTADWGVSATTRVVTCN